MKHLISFILALLTPVVLNAQRDSAVNKEKLSWYTDVVKASEISRATNKPLFAFFTGSDWCVWCKKLQAEVFAKPAFIQWAKKNVVLVELDFPRYKALSPELVQQNNSLQQTFQVQGFPAIWLFFLNKNPTAAGYTIAPLGTLGYPRGAEPGREEVKFIGDANALLTKGPVKQ